MIWRNPMAWLGLAAVAVPVLVHLLARRTTRRVTFPTLQFIDPARLAPARRRRLTDLALLCVRIGIVVAAVAALAQPWVLTAGRQDAVASRLVRAVVVDSSDSMRQPDTAGRVPLDEARADAAVRVEDVAAYRLVESDDPGPAVVGAAAWLLTESGRRELVVISDFQPGAVGAADVAAIDASIGLRLVAIETPSARTAQATYQLGDLETTANATTADDRTDFVWQTRPTADAVPLAVVVLAGADEAAAASLTIAAGRLSRLGATSGPVTLVLPGAASRDALLERAGPIDEPWMLEVLAGVRQDETVGAAARAATSADAPGFGNGRLTPVVLAPDREPLAFAGAASVDGGHRLLIFLATGARDMFTAAVLAALPAGRAGGGRADFAELDPDRIAEATLRGWQRDATPAAAAAGGGRTNDSDGRWLWLLALVLLVVEGWMRRERASPATAAPREATHARVA
jgi:hypothetical protein